MIPKTVKCLLRWCARRDAAEEKIKNNRGKRETWTTPPKSVRQ